MWRNYRTDNWQRRHIMRQLQHVSELTDHALLWLSQKERSLLKLLYYYGSWSNLWCGQVERSYNVLIVLECSWLCLLDEAGCVVLKASDIACYWKHDTTYSFSRLVLWPSLPEQNYHHHHLLTIEVWEWIMKR